MPTSHILRSMVLNPIQNIPANPATARQGLERAAQVLGFPAVKDSLTARLRIPDRMRERRYPPRPRRTPTIPGRKQPIAVRPNVAQFSKQFSG